VEQLRQLDVAYEPLAAIEETRKMLGAPRVNMSVLWTVVTRLASDLRWALAQIDALRDQQRDLRANITRLNGASWLTEIDPVGGSDSAEPSSDL